jgi:hypothetical protein
LAYRQKIEGDIDSGLGGLLQGDESEMGFLRDARDTGDAIFDRARTRVAAATGADCGAALLRGGSRGWDRTKNEQADKQGGESVFQHAVEDNT